jgi:hypothetical protein
MSHTSISNIYASLLDMQNRKLKLSFMTSRLQTVLASNLKELLLQSFQCNQLLVFQTQDQTRHDKT